LVRSQLNLQILSYDQLSPENIQEICGLLDVMCPCNRIILRAEKALRVVWRSRMNH